MRFLKQKILKIATLLLLTLVLSGCEVLEVVEFILTEIIELEESAGSIVDGSLTEVHFIDSGNSDSILIKNNGRFAMIDVGDTDDDELILNYLRQEGVKTLDYLIVTHFHADHFGAADSVVKEFEVLNTFVSNGDANTRVYRQFIEALSEKGLKPSVPLEGEVFQLGNATLRFYNTKSPFKDANNKSLVTLLDDGMNKALFTGDAEKAVEDSLLSIKELKNIDLYKAGHHGSSTSNSEAFMKYIAPKEVVIMVGEGNKYGHPHREVIGYLEENNIKYSRTDKDGTVIYEMSGNGLKRVQ